MSEPTIEDIVAFMRQSHEDLLAYEQRLVRCLTSLQRERDAFAKAWDELRKWASKPCEDQARRDDLRDDEVIDVWELYGKIDALDPRKEEG
ncbi:MAG: hypothetical protein RL885_24960 [Planctomycetota bacterium]